MPPKKKHGSKALEQARQRIADKLVRVEEERRSLQVYQRVLSTACSDLISSKGTCRIQGERAVESTFSEIEGFFLQLKEDCLQAVRHTVAGCQSRIESTSSRLEALEHSMIKVRSQYSTMEYEYR